MLAAPLALTQPLGAAAIGMAADGRQAHRPPAASIDEIRPLWKAEREQIEHALSLCGGNVLQAAARLEISDSTIYRKRRAWLERGDA